MNFIFHDKCLVPVIFMSSNAYGIMCFWRLAINWPALMTQWEAVESKLPKHSSELEKYKLAYSIKMISLVVMLVSLSKFSVFCHIFS